MGYRSKPITGKLVELQKEIQGYADEFGLDYFEQIFEMCDFDTVNILAAQGGFPARYPHWRFGMDYDQMSKGYRYGIQKIYEMVINTDPCYAYLLDVNNWVDQKLVMAHVYGHNDFFKNNMWFSGTNRKMMDVMANHGTKVRRYMTKYGHEKVEDFIDCVLSIENLIDINGLFGRRDPNADEQKEKIQSDDRSSALKTFMRSKIKENIERAEPVTSTTKEIKESLAKGERDIMYFLINNAPLEDWQIDIIGILREEAYYFLPQRLTKIMNEGWASYWHSKIMTERAMDSSEVIEFADKHAGVMVMSKERLNPYKIGIELMRDIEHRWDTGKFGKEYNDCTDMKEKLYWDTGLKKGREKIFEVRRTHNDISFIDEFLTPEFCERQQLFTYKYNPRTGRNEIDKKDFEGIKAKLLNQLTNFGSPLIIVEDDNFKNRKELLLKHVHFDADLDKQFASATLQNMFRLWTRPVHILTLLEGKEAVLSFDGKEFTVTE